MNAERILSGKKAVEWSVRGLIALLVLVSTGAGAVLPVQAAIQSPESALQSIDRSIDTLLLVKDDRTLSREEREAQELVLRRKIVREAIELSRREVTSMRERLQSVRTENETLEARRLRLQKGLAAWDVYYAEQLRAAETTTTTEEVKKIASAVKETRGENMSALAQNAFDLVLVGQLATLVETAQTRSEKIAYDLTKLERAGVVKPGYFRKEMQESSRFIEAAKSLKNQATKRLTDEEKAFSEKEARREKTSGGETKVTETTSTDGTVTQEVEERVGVQPTTREIVEAAVVNLKSGYDAFLRISHAVKKILH